MSILVVLTTANCVTPPEFVVVNHSDGPVTVAYGERQHRLAPGAISRRLRYVTRGTFAVARGACVHTYREPDWAGQPLSLDQVKQRSPEIFKRAGGYGLNLAIEIAPDLTLRAFVFDFRNRETAPLAPPELHAGGFPLAPQTDCAQRE